MNFKNPQWLWIFVQPFLFVALLWGVFGLDYLFNLELYKYSLIPRDISQWFGVFTFPLLHGGIEHIAGNSWTLFVLLTGVRYFFPKVFDKVFWVSWILPGLFTWFFARDSYHLGASGMVYALVTFLLISGIVRANRYLWAMSLLIVFSYGYMFWYIFPIEDGISWEGHLSGAFTGIILSYLFRKVEPTHLVREKEYFVDETEEEEDPLIGDLWKHPSERKPVEQPEDVIRYIYKKKETN